MELEKALSIMYTATAKTYTASERAVLAAETVRDGDAPGATLLHEIMESLMVAASQARRAMAMGLIVNRNTITMGNQNGKQNSGTADTMDLVLTYVSLEENLKNLESRHSFGAKGGAFGDALAARDGLKKCLIHLGKHIKGLPPLKDLGSTDPYIWAKYREIVDSPSPPRFTRGKGC